MKRLTRIIAAVAVLGALAVVLTLGSDVITQAHDSSSAAGVAVLILSPVIFLAFAIVLRGYLEMTIGLFKDR